MSNPNNPLTLVIFGVTGDLYKHKLGLALFNLFSQGLLPKHFTVVGFARRSLSDLDFKNITKDAILEKIEGGGDKQKNLDAFLEHLKYIQGDLENLEDFKNLSKTLAEDDQKIGVCTNKLFYLATPPSLYEIIFKNISGAGLTVPCAPGLDYRDAAWTRVLVEKPFGEDLNKAEKLDELLGTLFDESQIFRIDHYLSYLSKGVVEKILNFHFAPTPSDENESSFNNKNIKSVHIIFHEKDLVRKRGPFYDALGAFRDVGQSHMLQMLALVAMDNPRDEKTEKNIEIQKMHKSRQQVLEKTKLSDKDVMVRGQYEGYLEESGIKPGSQTETFFRLVFFVDNPKWQGIPFVLEFGKGLDRSQVFIEICFTDKKSCINFQVSEEHTHRDAYEKVFYDCLLGDQTIFISTGEIIAQWKLATDVIEKWRDTPLVIYKKGSSADLII